MGTDRKYLVAVALLAVLAVVFGLAGTVAPVSELVSPQESSSSSSDSVTHFMNPPTYDSGWINISDKVGQHFTLTHSLNTTEVVVDITGKKSLVPEGGALAWSRTYGGANNDIAYSVVQTGDGGYVLAGSTVSFGAGGYDFYLVKTDASGNMQWNQTYGGTSNDEAWSVVKTSDGGYALAGSTVSFDAGSADFWLVKTDASGNMLWNQTYGGTDYDDAYSVVKTSDGGYALAGRTESFGAGGNDFYLVKTDASGNMLWNQTYGGTGNDFAAWSVVQTFDGGYVLAGYTFSFGAGGFDFWLVKTDASGNMLWNQTYGGTGHDYATSVVQTIDGGYVLVGYTYSFGAGERDFWLVKTDASGNMLWNQTYGGIGADCAYSVVKTSDGGYVLAGFTESFGAGGYDFWLLKMKAEANLEHKIDLGGTGVIPGWSQCYGGGSSEEASSVVATSDGGYAIAGHTFSYGAGSCDIWLVKTDSGGNMEWSQTYGGTSSDLGTSMVQTLDGGYALAGYTGSYGAGVTDFWLVKTDASGNHMWNKTFGGPSEDRAYSVVQTSDGGYAIAGLTYTGFDYDVWLVKTDASGNSVWNKTYGGPLDNSASSVIQTSDGGYALAGYTTDGSGDYQLHLFKTDTDGNDQWSKKYGGTDDDRAYSVVQTSDGGYALVGYTNSYGAGGYDFWLFRTDAAGNHLWNKTYGDPDSDRAWSVIQTSDGGYAMSGEGFAHFVETDESGNQRSATMSYERNPAYSLVETFDGGYALAGSTHPHYDFWLAKTYVETGLTMTGLTNQAIVLYRGRTDPYWNYVRVRIWTIEEPTWMFGDINQDGVVDAKDLYIVSRNYGKTFSLLSLTGILAITGIYTYKKRKKQPT